MAANAELLQGNLFGNAELQSTAQKSTQSFEQTLGGDLSDQDLVGDALKRPRARHQPAPDISNTVVSESSEHASADEDDLPAWGLLAFLLHVPIFLTTKPLILALL